ncbi:hypothetical protein BY458DRAFT_559644 [Sporodiniella umbellata]|nr:hypothetical protein BY458DRAFT_559644 [Sporodiniella umbellata]
MNPSERKRPFVDEVNQDIVPSVPTRPPLKKRFTSSMNVQQPPSHSTTPLAIQTAAPMAIHTVMTPSTPIEPPTPIENFPISHVDFPIDLDTYSKEALLTHMRSAKDEVNYLENKHEALEHKFINRETNQSLLRINWNLIQNEILFMAKILVNLDLPEPSTPLLNEMNIDQQKDWCYNSLLSIKELGTKALTRLESWSKQAELIERKYRLEDDIMLRRVIISDWLKSEMVDLEESYQRGEQVAKELQQKLESLVEQTQTAEGDVASAKRQLKHGVEKLEICVQELSSLCKKKDRAKSKTVMALEQGGLGEITEGGNTNNEIPTTNEEPVAKKEAMDIFLEGSSTEEQTVKAQIEEHRAVLSAREKEIEALKKDRQTLLQHEDRLLSMFKLSEEQLLETEYIRTLQLSIDHYRSRCHDLEQRRVELERDLDGMSATRKQLIDQVKTEKASQNATLEAEIRRIEGDLNRIRGQRDSFQSLVDEQKAKEGREKENQERIISFAAQGKTRILSLESRIDKLKNEQEMAGPFEKEATMYNNLKEQLKQMNILLSSIELIEKRDFENILQFDSDSLQKALEKHSSHALVKEYDQALEESRKATLMADFFEKNEGHLLEEIDRVASIYGKLEEQQSKRIFDFNQKRDQILKLQAETLKYAQTFGSLLSAKEKQISTVASLKITKEKQQELIKQLEEKEKNLEIRVVEKESELRKLNRNIEEDRIDLEDISHVCDDYRVTIDQNDIMLLELQKMLKEKTKAFDEERQLQENTKESYDKMKKKWEKISQGDNPMEEQLAEECDELRVSTSQMQYMSYKV